ncbi:hypothetical protein BKI51_15215 [Alphaproteobacteria bacterium AO1-B]|nr:hypothetical protein BKI51_15215 [Alphaproteobacteria bacterium AO1-B]
MRVTSELFVSALVRRIFSENGFAAVTRKGNAEAGAILIVLDRLDGTFDLYSPAPQSFFNDDAGQGDGGRLFEKTLEAAAREAVDKRLESEARMDPDFWVVDIEAEAGNVQLPTAEPEQSRNPADDFFRL